MDHENLNENNFDKWNGYSSSLFNFQNDEEDREAEQAYEYVDKRMDERRREQRDKKIEEELKKL
jgi:hypothetical protein